MKLSRRDFVRSGVGGALAVGTGAFAAQAAQQHLSAVGIEFVAFEMGV